MHLLKPGCTNGDPQVAGPPFLIIWFTFSFFLKKVENLVEEKET
jgi:hypothetical protein